MITSDEKSKTMWHLFNGTVEQGDVLSVEQKQSMYNVFANTYCLLISHSLLACNLNVQILFPGPVSVYITKYLKKPTQDEDTGEYSKTMDRMQRRLTEQRKVDDLSEGISRVITASFIHNSYNVVSSPMARYLVRNKTRFAYSHRFVFIPANDIFKILSGESLRMNVRSSRNGKKFLENTAFHYIYRPTALKHLDPVSFYSQYKIVLK